MPILTGSPVFVKSVPNGKLYMVGSGDDTIPVVHVWGTPYQKGLVFTPLLHTHHHLLIAIVVLPNQSIDQRLLVHCRSLFQSNSYAHGLLMKDKAEKMANAVWAYLESEVERAINGSIGPISPEVAKWIADIGLGAALDFTSYLTQVTHYHCTYQHENDGSASGILMDGLCSEFYRKVLL
jgi:isopenicillin-N N-acyltransferase-like protein